VSGVFISYRREDCPGHAGRIFDRLRSRFGGDVVFMDVTAIEAGVDFVEVLHKAVGSCDALLAVIGPQWLSATHDGKRRLDDPRDFVRLEIAGALERKVRVLPVLVEGASVPSTEDLPADLQALTRRQAIELRDARWDDDIERLVEGLEKFLKAGSPSGQSLTPREDAPPPTPATAGADRSSAKTTSGRGIAIGALAALILVVAATLAWRGTLVPGSSVGTATDPPQQTVTPAQTVGPADQPAVTSASNPGPAASESTSPRPIEASSIAKPAEAAPTPSPSRAATPSGPANAPTSSPGSANARPVPDVMGKTILEAREILRNAGFRFLIRLREDKSQVPGIVETQQLDESTGSTQPRRVLLTAVATSTISVHVAKGDEQKAEALVAYLKDQPSTIGSFVRPVSAVPRAELVGRVGYSDDRLAAQAAAIAKDASEYLARTGNPRPLQATLRPRIVPGHIIVALYEGAQ
jgi:hypothetical protein